ncbi:hypothetical protein P4G94_22615 [Bacillus cereus]|nr:hypothetical protein [Bacillus cereus]
MDNEKDLSAREAKKAYMRAWRAANKEKVKATQERYWKKVAQKMNMEESEIKNDTIAIGIRKIKIKEMITCEIITKRKNKILKVTEKR